MPDETKPQTSAPSDPNKSGKESSEFSLSRLAMIFAAVLAGLIATLTQLQTALPSATWIPAVIGILGGILAMVVIVVKYTGGRSDVKVEQIAQAGALAVAEKQLEAAKTIAAAGGTAVLDRVFTTKPAEPPSP